MFEADRMKAEEVLKRYQAGERNFRRVNLRGQSFKGKDLSRADFSEADIRGSNFTNAILTGTNFSYAKAGLQRPWVIGLSIISLVLAAITGFISAMACYLVVHFFLVTSIEHNIEVVLFALVVIAAFLINIIRQGLEAPFWSVAKAIFTDMAKAGAFIVGFIAALVNVVLPAAKLTVGAPVAVAMAVAPSSAYIWLVCFGKAGERIVFAFTTIGGTSFRGADLTDADFNQAVLDGADFKKAILTRTNIGIGNEQVRPTTNTKDIINFTFRKGIDWQAFKYSFNKLVVENEGTQLSVQSIEDIGNGVLVIKVKVPLGTDPVKISDNFKTIYKNQLKVLGAKYKAELKGKDEQLACYRQQSAMMNEIISVLGKRDVIVEINNKNMNDRTDQSRKIEISGGTIHASGAGAFNLGDISGTVANSINQLPASPEPDQVGIKELLEQLKAAIESESDLSDDNKTTALEQVKVLAEAGQKPKDVAMQKAAKSAITMLRGTVAVLPSTATLVEACSKLLPLITKLFGLG